MNIDTAAAAIGSELVMKETNTRPDQRRRRKAYLRRIISVVKDTPCHDCGIKSTTMTFDHLPEFTKKGNVNDFVRNKSRRSLLIEMAKCDVVCRKCHDIRERKRGR